jgi:hypothetical protein
VTGRPRGAAAWQEALVSLLGPLPGILLGLVCFFAIRRTPTLLTISIVQVLLFLNLFNLLPLGGLDGGRFLGRVLFSRHPLLDIAFQAIGSLLLAIFGLATSMYVLAAFAAFGLLLLPMRWRVLRAAGRLRRERPSMLADPEALGEEDGRAVFEAARALLPAQAGNKPASLAGVMEQLLDATKPAPRVMATLGLLALYGVGLLIGLVGVVVVASQTGPASWRAVQGPSWRAEFPNDPVATAPTTKADGVERVWRASVDGTQRFAIVVTEHAAPVDLDRWIDEASRGLAAESGMTVARTSPAEVTGASGRAVDLSSGGRVMRALLVAAGNRSYQVTASAPAWNDNQSRFLDSFKVVPPLP